MEEKKSRFSEIRATAFDAVVIMRQIGTPGVLESLSNVRDTTSKVNDIIKSLQTPEMVKNIENFRLISEHINGASKNLQDTVHELKETGVIDKASSLIDSAKKQIDSFGNGEGNLSSQDIHDLIISTQEMFGSIKGLVGEITETISSTKKSETVASVKESIHGA